MNRLLPGLGRAWIRVPRASGDEPFYELMTDRAGGCSPRERG